MRISDWSSDVCSSDLSTGFQDWRWPASSVKTGGALPGSYMIILPRPLVPIPAHNAAYPRICALRYGLSSKLRRSEEHTSELQSLMRISYAVFCLKKKQKITHKTPVVHQQDIEKHIN